jgi:hypothetical protein
MPCRPDRITAVLGLLGFKPNLPIHDPDFDRRPSYPLFTVIQASMVTTFIGNRYSWAVRFLSQFSKRYCFSQADFNFIAPGVYFAELPGKKEPPTGRHLKRLCLLGFTHNPQIVDCG